MKNIELKVKLRNFGRILGLLPAIKARKFPKLIQVDTYYSIKGKARLKIREINNKKFELIYYKRPDIETSKLSDYKIVNIAKENIGNLKEVLKEILGVLVIVKKERNLWTYRNTRIHFDKVSGLGNFIELETVVKNIKLSEAIKEHNEVIKLLGLNKYKRQSGSYSDLLLEKC